MHIDPDEIRHEFVDADGVRLHLAAAGDPAAGGGLVVFAHGFPEFWYAWRRQLREFGRDRLAVAPDLRGYNRSSKPAGEDRYRVPFLVEDLLAVADHFGREAFTLVGHDWGGIVAWALAAAHPKRLHALVAVNAPHPALFRRELAENPSQQEASQYIQVLRSPGAEELLSANDFDLLKETVVEPGIREGWLDEEDARRYVEAWSRPGALTGALNYYRAADLGPGGTGADDDGAEDPAADLPGTVDVPTLVIWGERDPYLLTGNLRGLDELVPDLTVHRVPDAGHWVVHERPDLVNRLLREFLDEA